MFEIKNNEKINKAMSLRGRAVGSDVVIFHAETNKAQLFLSRCGASEKQKESSLVQRKSERQAIFKFGLSSASGGAGGGKYNRISAFVSMSVLLIRRSLEKFFQKNFRDDSSSCFGFAKILALALLFTFITTAESRAETWNCGEKDEQGNYGDNVQCTYDEDTQTITVSGKGNMGGYNWVELGNDTWTTDSPWHDKIVRNVVVGDNILNIGQSAFSFNPDLETVTGMKDVEYIEASAFNLDFNLQQFEFSEKLKAIGGNALQGPEKLGGQVFELPDTLEFVEMDALKFDGVFIIPDSINTEGWHNDVFAWHAPTFVCKGNINVCQNKIAKFIRKTEGGIGTCETGRCVDSEAYTLVEANIEQCTGNYGWNGKNCVKKDEDGNVTCASGFVEWNNACVDEYPFAKKRWTPAEANEWLHDGNDNFVIITFKK